MKGKRFKEEQIIHALKEVEAGMSVAEMCRKYGVSDATYYNWKSKYGGLSISEAKRLKSLEDENSKLKKMVANLMLDNDALKALISKNF